MSARQKQLLATATVLLGTAETFSVVPTRQQQSSTALNMGLFDGVKEAFAAPALERSGVDPERETPIDRWMGWSVVSETQQEAATPAGTYLRPLDRQLTKSEKI